MWGFIWVIIGSILYGISYVSSEVIWCVGPLPDIYSYLDGLTGDIVSAMLVASIQAITYAIVIFFVVTVVLGRTKDYVRTFRNWRISKWFFLGMLFGGPMAVFGSTMAVGFIGGAFSSAFALLEAIVAVALSHYAYKEKVSKKTIWAVLLLIFGGMLVTDPYTLYENIVNPGSSNVWLGYLGGLMAAVGWGVETTFDGRALEISEPGVGTAVRYTQEIFIWAIIFLPLTALIIGWDNFAPLFCDFYSNGDIWFWAFSIGMTFGVGDAMFYKGIPIMGAGRALSMSSLYAPISFIFLYLFLGSEISIWLVIGMIICVVGTFIMFWEREDIQDSIKNWED